MNAKPDTWRCEECGNSYPDQEAADRCCQPKPEPEPEPESPPDFSVLREALEKLPLDESMKGWNVDQYLYARTVFKNAPRLIDLAERCKTVEKERERLKFEIAMEKEQSKAYLNLATQRADAIERLEKERERPKSELADIKSESTGLTANDTALVEFFRGGNKYQRGLVAIIDRLASAAPRLNWRRGGAWKDGVEPTMRTTIVYYAGCGLRIEEYPPLTSVWAEVLWWIPVSELAATLPTSEQRKDGGT